MFSNLITESYKSKFKWLPHHQLWLAAGLLVTLPVFLQAPLVRFAPWLSLVITVGWLSLSRNYQNHWGSLTWGFALTWLCGSLYWGWLRYDPLWHLPIEALALPWAIWGLSRSAYRIGSYFYLGSLVGTAVTDLYFWLAGLMPTWRLLVQQEKNTAALVPLLQGALHQVETPWGIGLGAGFAVILLGLGKKVMSIPAAERWTFAGAVTFTLLTDVLFGLGIFFMAVSE